LSAGTAAADVLHETTLELFATQDPGAIAAKAVDAATRLFPVDMASIWVRDGDLIECRGAVGDGSDRVTGKRVPLSAAADRLDGEAGQSISAAPMTVNGSLAALLRVSRARVAGDFTDAEHDLLRQLGEAAGAAIASANRLAASEEAVSDSSRDLAVITEMSREIVSTLDLDRVLRSVVNLATRMITFDRGAIALYERGACDIRAMAGTDSVEARNAAMQDLAVRAAWAAGNGEHLYLSDRLEPGSDAERIFAGIFGVDLERDDVSSGLYLPLKDEEGIVGILLFEAERTDFVTLRQRELALILANQATVAIRNARLYQQVPLADTLGAIRGRTQALFAIPRRRRMTYGAIALLALGLMTLVRWPLRVPGHEPVFRPLWRADVRPTISGVVERVFVTEGKRLARGEPVAQLRDDELRAEYGAAVAANEAAQRTAAAAASRGDAAEERLQRLRGNILQREADLLDGQIRSAVVRSPIGGVVLTARPEDRIGTRVEAGDLFAVVGSTDSLELELGVEQRDVVRIRAGDEVRLRVSALPQTTFAGRVVSIASLPTDRDGGVWFPVRAVVANPDGLLRPGMVAHARVLTAPTSLLGRLVRGPARAIRLLWWRMWS
jgi:GAF domain-containing protein/biotin carboxyl carrier protein